MTLRGTEVETLAAQLERDPLHRMQGTRQRGAAMLRQLKQERDDFLEQLASRQRTALERDMQEVMEINNRLRAEIEQLKWNAIIKRANIS